MSGITGISWVTSAFANGACTDLDAKRKATTEAQINLKLHKINAIKSKTLRCLLREEKLTGPAIAEAHQMIAQEEADTRNNATTDELVRHLMQHMHLHPEGTDELGELEAEDPYELIVSHLQSLKSPSEAEWQQMLAKMRTIRDKVQDRSSNPVRMLEVCLIFGRSHFFGHGPPNSPNTTCDALVLPHQESSAKPC